MTPARTEPRRRELALGAFVLLVAIVVRAAVFVQLVPGPALHLRSWTQSDMHFFDHWARAVAAGDLLTRADMRPYHGRHRELACEAFVRGGGASEACDDEAIRTVWDRWVGRATFWQDPLYPYVLAVAYRLFGHGVLVGYGLNLLLGLSCVLLVFRIGCVLGGSAAGTWAGLLAAFYGPLIFYETLLLRAVAISAAGLALVGSCMRLMVRPDASRSAVAVGVLAGICVLLKASTIPLVAVLAAAVLWRWRRRLRQGRRSMVLAACGLAVVLSPLVARNLAVGIAPLQLASTGALNFLNGNAADRTSTGGSIVSELAAAILERTDGRAFAVVEQTISSHDQLLGWLDLVVRKALAFWTAAEIPNNASYEYFRSEVSWLRHCFVGFVVVAALAPLGIPRGLRSCAPLAPLLLYVGVGVATCALFYNLSRFRLPIACALLPLSGCALASGVELLAARRWISLALAAGVVLALGLLSARSSGGVASVRIADYGVSNAIAAHLARQRMEGGDFDGALRIVARQLATEPAELRRVTPGPEPTRIDATMSGVAGTFVDLHGLAAELYERRDEIAAAREQRDRAAVLDRLNAPYRGQNP